MEHTGESVGKIGKWSPAAKWEILVAKAADQAEDRLMAWKQSREKVARRKILRAGTRPVHGSVSAHT